MSERQGGRARLQAYFFLSPSFSFLIASRDICSENKNIDGSVQPQILITLLNMLHAFRVKQAKKKNDLCSNESYFKHLKYRKQPHFCTLGSKICQHAAVHSTIHENLGLQKDKLEEIICLQGCLCAGISVTQKCNS